MIRNMMVLPALILVSGLVAQKPYGREPLAHTYSIVAIDPETGDMGVAVQSHWFATGTIVIWGEAGTGVVATQSFVNPAFGPEGLALMKNGMIAPDALAHLIASDEGRDFRQLALLDSKGRVAAYTGSKCIEAAGHQEGAGYSVQANLMANGSVWPAMAKAFEASKGQPLAERMLLALEAAEAAGGDIRGKQSAALLVVSAKNTGQSWVDRKVDLRIDDHPTPLPELRRLLRVHQAYGHMNAGDLAVEKGDMAKAMEEYGAAEALFPDNLEMQYWHAIALVNAGKTEEAMPLFRKIFLRDGNWKTLTPRLTKNGLLVTSEETLQQILQLPSKQKRKLK
ncbi:MAG: DUF1028 domain-containing protein [Haliscomenobacter sp.]|nr:DUF1028 domain-containing protein [Haliscomenobacter sp.]